ncbi:DNA alkylation repair protein [Bradyrhizobium barranii]|uniref:DNA alkylation repair protein n=1 Tax=Bradyrhizobium barranii subsp. barranii TaxID=2823807 RepID=A0A7Z0Q8M4_9BRAD
MAWTGRAARQFQRCRDRLELYEELIVNGAWWDYVDPVAGALFWPLLRDDRKEMTSAMRGWSRSADFWNRF